MPSQTFLVRAHARTIHTHPVTFVCAECHTTTTREIYPGKMPTYCLSCRPRRKQSAQERSTKGMFHPTHYLIAANGRKTEVCLEKSSNPGWFWVRTALDWFSGSSIIQYHPEKGIISHETPLEGYTLTPLPEELQVQTPASKAKSKVKKKADTQTEPVEDRPYSGRQMMKRLKCGDRLLRIKRSQPDFKEWSQQRDPDGVAWKYQDGQFVSLKVAQVDTSPVEETQPKPSKSKSKTKQKQKTTNKTKKTTVTQAPSLESKSLSGRQMMKRLKCGDRLLRIKRSQPDFSEWSQKRDPEGVAWQYKGDQFVPLEVSTLDSEPAQVEAQPKTSKSKAKTKSKTNQKQKTVKKKTTKKTKEKASAPTTSLENRAYTVRQVMERFHCGDRLLRIKRDQPDFSEWSKGRDPDGIAWQYQDGQFVPNMG